MPWSDVLEIGVRLLDGLVTWANVGTGSRRKHAEARGFRQVVHIIKVRVVLAEMRSAPTPFHIGRRPMA